MKAVVMAGGEGSRLRPLTSRHPKPLVPVVGTPVIEHILRLLREHDIKQVVITLAYLGADIRNHLGDGSELDMEIEYVVEDRPLGTAGSVRNAAHLLDDTFLVISGDALTDLDVTSVVREHRERGAQASIVLRSVPNPLEYGVVVTDGDGNVKRFLEKPSWGEVFSDQANTGIYVVEPGVLEHIKPDTVSDWSQDVFPAMLRRRQPLIGVPVDAYWCDIGSIHSYMQANWDALDGRVRCHIPGRREGEAWIGEGVEFGLNVQIEGPAFIGDEVKLKAGAFINDRAVIDRFTIVDDYAKVSNSIVWPHSYVGEHCRLRQAIVCRNVTVKNSTLLEENSVIGDDCLVGRGSRIRAGVKIWPNKEIEPGSTVNESVVWAGEWRRGLFSSYGMGGLINVELTPEFCARLGAAFGATLPKGARVAVGRDHARSSRMIKRAIVSGIVSTGGVVRDVRELPVPVTQFATRDGRCDAGIQVIVSPLDQRSADIRFLDSDGLQIDKRAERKLENLLFREDFRRSAFYEMGDIEYVDPVRSYQQHLLASINADAIRAANFRLLVDYDYSEASSVLPGVLNDLGVTTIPLNAGLREGPHHRGVPEETSLISRTVQADVGCMLSPTGERLTLIDDTGVTLTPYETFGILAAWFLRSRPGIVLAPAAAPGWISQLVRDNGGTFTSTPSEPAMVLRASAVPGTCLATDGDGGFIWPYYFGAYDAMYTIVKLLELRASVGIPLSEARAQLPSAAYVTATEFCPWEAKGRVMRMLLDAHRDSSVDLVDGIKIFVDDGFVLVRPDPDEPAYHIVASVANEEDGRTLVSEYARRVREAQHTNGARPSAELVAERETPPA
ncbi:MAG: NTP transferase domain-containing protein [Candidatus Dormibacteraeota bacterium]|nr:NTP transferase domain-containing protein [Candidatus Dormibacteraeota bacterium]